MKTEKMKDINGGRDGIRSGGVQTKDEKKRSDGTCRAEMEKKNRGPEPEGKNRETETGANNRRKSRNGGI